jgi:hypothetical protein
MSTLITFTIDAAFRRNAREAIQTRVQGATTLLDDPVTIRDVSATSLEVQLPDALPAEELRSIIAGLANLVRRPESGILSNVVVSPEDASGAARQYSV